MSTRPPLLASALLALLGLSCAKEAAPEATLPTPPVTPEPGPPPATAQPGATATNAIAPSATATFPLHEGDTWVWDVVRSTGAGVRVLWLTSEPATSERIERWTLTVGAAQPDGSFLATWSRAPASGLTTTASFSLSHDANGALLFDPGTGPVPALTLQPPPEPVSVEVVPCVAHLFGDLPAMCSPAPGGPLQVAPGPHTLTVQQDRDGGRKLAQIVVGVLTAGTLIPGNRSATELATLQSYTTRTPPAPESPELTAWKRSPKLSQLRREGPLDRETAAAMVALTPPPEVSAVAAALLPRLADRDRWSLLRVALQRSDDVEVRLSTLAALTQADTPAPDPAATASVAALLRAEEQPAATALIEQTWPTLRRVLLAPPTDRLAALAPTSTVAEAEAVLRRFHDADDRLTALERLLPHLPPEGADALMLAALADASLFDRRFALLERQSAWLGRQTTDAAARALFNAFTFDADRSQAFVLLRNVAPLPRTPTLLRVAVEAMAFDDGRLALLTEHPDLRERLTAADKALVLAAFVFKKDEAARLLGG